MSLRPHCRVQESQGRVGGGRVVEHCSEVNLASSSHRGPPGLGPGEDVHLRPLWGQEPRHRRRGRKRKAERRNREVGRERQRQQELERQRERGWEDAQAKLG